MVTIPKIIHQIWEGKTERLPDAFVQFSNTWKEYHPDWQYEFWDKKRMDAFVRKEYPEFSDIYFGYRYDVQRWDAIRYLILYRMGGVYADFDYECLEPMDSHIQGKTCCLGFEPETHASMLKQPFVISNAWIAAESKHPFLKHLIETLASSISTATDKVNTVLETTGSLMLTKAYNAYHLKNEVTLFPAAVTSPWTHQEVQMYLRNEISEVDLEKKLQDAIFLHYHWQSWQKNSVRRKKSDVLYLSLFNGMRGGGGAARAAYRIHKGLRQYGIDSVMLTKFSSESSEGIYMAQTPRNSLMRDQAPLADYPNRPNMMMYFCPASIGMNLQKYLRLFNPEILQLHWVSWYGFLRIEDLAKVKQKIVWRLPDSWAFTGGCHFPGTCTGYMHTCGNCPQLGSDKSDDLSHQIWQRKHDAWKNTDITVVVPTQWMKEVAQKSSLFGKRRIELIPNGLDVELFSPLDKEAVRKIMKLPLNKKIILYGASYAVHDPRKGFSYLFEALQKLSHHRNEYEVVVFGSSDTPMKLDIPIRFLGFLEEHLLLQMAYSAADVMIVPSLEEPFGQTVTEAMACAAPVVVFSGTGPAGIVDHQVNGYIAQHSDSEDLAKGIEWVLDNEQRRQKLSANARQKVLDIYDIRVVVEQYAQLYKSLK